MTVNLKQKIMLTFDLQTQLQSIYSNIFFSDTQGKFHMGLSSNGITRIRVYSSGHMTKDGFHDHAR